MKVSEKIERCESLLENVAGELRPLGNDRNSPYWLVDDALDCLAQALVEMKRRAKL